MELHGALAAQARARHRTSCTGCARRFAPGGLLHFGQGKWYPGEALPRWALSCFWRRDGTPLWEARTLLPGLAGEAPGHATRMRAASPPSSPQALGLAADFVLPAYEDPWKILRDESNLPLGLDPLAEDLADGAVRSQARARSSPAASARPSGYVLPLKRARARASPRGATKWASSPWPLRRGHVFLLEGDSPMGYRLPLASLPAVLPEDEEPVIAADPFERRDALGKRKPARAAPAAPCRPRRRPPAREVVRTALCVEAREGRLHVFLPPVALAEDFVALVGAIEATSRALARPGAPRGLPAARRPAHRALRHHPGPGRDRGEHPPGLRLGRARAPRDRALRGGAPRAPGHREVHARRPPHRHRRRQPRHHRRPHRGGQPAAAPPGPAALASSPTGRSTPRSPTSSPGSSSAPRARARAWTRRATTRSTSSRSPSSRWRPTLPPGETNEKPWLVDRILRNFLVDLTGNTHRAEFSIDKLYAPGSATGRLGLLEFRAFEMPPHARMSLAQMLLLRALVARFWKAPFKERLVDWGTRLHDAFMLPHFVAQDLRHVVEDLQGCGLRLPPRVVRAVPRVPLPALRHRDLRGHRARDPPGHRAVARAGRGGDAERHRALRRFLGGAPAGARLAPERDALRRRLQRPARAARAHRHARASTWPACATRPGRRPRRCTRPSSRRRRSSSTWWTCGTAAPSAAAPTTCRTRADATTTTFPVNALEAEARRVARFQAMGHTAGPMDLPEEARNPRFPLLLDLRKAREPSA